MKAEFIAIGDEILSGRTREGNGHWLASFFGSHGIKLSNISVIADDAQAIAEQLSTSWQRSELVIISGGLGPTRDDKTKKSIADFFSLDLLENETALKIAAENYSRLNRPFDPQISGYHLLPSGFVALNNSCGTAPGLLFQQDDKLLICAPGVPREFEQMIAMDGLKQIKKRLNFKSEAEKQVAIRTCGIAEEDIFFKLSTTLWNDLEQFGKVSSLPGNFAVDIIVTLNQADREQELKNWINKSPLAPYIWQIGKIPLAQFIIEKAIEKKLTISLAESCTGGKVSSTLTDVAGSSAAFLGSVVSYSNEAKQEIIDVPKKLIVDHGAVSTQVAKAMAQGSKQKFQSDIAISLTGIAGPGGGSKEKPVGTLALGLATSNNNQAELLQFTGDRLKLKERFTRVALFKLLELIEEIGDR